ncbi:lysozyme inhibitor LprI family protein [Siminovitchia sp. FSL W7-1587]|uniref:lysozyme inhibitor LprI family protein n=1 Tax=Siminovitchia sp. FSL W7-1587 TaxID=2954699 RepID=UPI0030CBE5A8
MKNNRTFLLGMLTVVFVILAACGNSSDESSAGLDKQSPNNNTQNPNADSSNADSAENDSNHDKANTADTRSETNEKADISTNELKEEDASTNQTASLKEEYLKKLNETKKEMDELKNNPEDDSTYALKKVEGDRYDVWDGLLNEVYEVLQKQLPSEEMDQLRKEQREWIAYRDNSAKEASLTYKGGTMEQLEFVAVQADITEERCFELVEDYME